MGITTWIVWIPVPLWADVQTFLADLDCNSELVVIIVAILGAISCCWFSISTRLLKWSFGHCFISWRNSLLGVGAHVNKSDWMLLPFDVSMSRQVRWNICLSRLFHSFRFLGIILALLWLTAIHILWGFILFHSWDHARPNQFDLWVGCTWPFLAHDLHSDFLTLPWLHRGDFLEPNELDSFSFRVEISFSCYHFPTAALAFWSVGIPW